MHPVKNSICGLVLRVLYRGIRVLSRCDSVVHEELLSIPDGLCVRFSVSSRENTPSLSFAVSDGTIQKSRKEPDIHITFKNNSMAFRVFTGRMGIAEAYAAHAFFMRGNLNQAMEIVRVINRVEGYLFPKFMSRRILQEVPKRQIPAIAVYLRLIPAK